MNALYRFSYHGETVTVLTQANDTDLVQIGDRFVRLGKVCQVKQKETAKIIQFPKILHEH